VIALIGLCHLTAAAASAPTVTAVSPGQTTAAGALALTINGSGFIQGVGSWPAGTRFFGNHAYLYQWAVSDWPTAEADCEAMGGTLVSIGSAAENEFVRSLLPDSQPVWIGLFDQGIGDFAWANGDPLVYTRWDVYEPLQTGPGVYVDILQPYGIWRAMHFAQESYICEFQSSAMLPTARLVRSGASDIVAINVALTDSGHLACDFDIPPGAHGVYDLMVANFDGGTATLAGGFEIVNTPPVAHDIAITWAGPGTTYGGFWADDANGDVLTYTIVGPPSHGVAIPLGGNSFAFTPDPGYVGNDSLTFIANDGFADSNIGTIAISVQDVVAPSLAILSPDVNAVHFRLIGSPGAVTVTGTASDNGGLAAVDYALSGATVATGTASGTSSWTFATPILNPGTTTVAVTAHDLAGNATSAVIYLVVDSVGTTVRINFQQAGAPVPAGYLADSG